MTRSLPLRFALRYLFARKSHNVINIISGIGVAGMAIGTAALILILSVFNGFNAVVDDSLTDADPDLCVKPAAGKFFVPDSTVFRWLYGQKAVGTMSSVLEEQAFLAYDGKQTLARVKGVDAVFEEESPLQDHIVDGQFTLHRGSMPRAVLGAGVALSLEASPRFLTPLEIFYPDRSRGVSALNPMESLRSVKTLPAGIVTVNAELDGTLVLVPLETMRTLLDFGEEVSAVEIRWAEDCPPQEAARVQKELSERLGSGFRVLDRYHQNEAVFKMMRYEKLAIYLILIFVIVIISFNILSSLTMLIIEKRTDIGTLRSLGAPVELTRRIFLLEGWLISLLGLVIGLAAGVALVLLQQNLGLVKMPGNFGLTAYPVILKATDLLWTAGGVALVGYLIALIPSRTINPQEN